MTQTTTPKLAVIGAGTMGNGIAQVFASSGSDVLLIDSASDALERGLATIEKNLGRLVDLLLLDQAGADAARARITSGTDISAISDQDLVVEAVVERADVKHAIFRQIDSLAKPGAILASNTSSISITAIAAATGRPDKVIGMHFMNPVPIMKLVEVISGLYTSEETLRTTVALAEDMGKTCVEARDFPGFAATRPATRQPPPSWAGPKRWARCRWRPTTTPASSPTAC